MQHARSVLTKTSDLPAEIRVPVYEVCKFAFLKTLAEIKSQTDPEKEPK